MRHVNIHLEHVHAILLHKGVILPVALCTKGAYYIHSNGEAAIIDPLREIKPYLERAANDGVKIKYIFETHFHADFVSGHVTLAENTGAPIIYGPNANPSFDAHIAKDGDVFKLGDVTISVLHTPGHTMESTTYLLADKNGKNHSIFVQPGGAERG